MSSAAAIPLSGAWLCTSLGCLHISATPTRCMRCGNHQMAKLSDVLHVQTIKHGMREARALARQAVQQSGNEEELATSSFYRPQR